MPVLTYEQKAKLQINDKFRKNAKGAMLELARVFIASDGTTPPGSATKVKWAQYRFLGRGFVNNPASLDNDQLYQAFAMYVTDSNLTWSDADGGDSVVATLVSGGRFDAIADMVMTDRTLGVDF